jgi:hypothetical protein
VCGWGLREVGCAVAAVVLAAGVNVDGIVCAALGAGC